jgi:hypothetical protein
MGWYGLDPFGSGEGPVEGSCEHGIEPSGSIKCSEFIELLHNWRFLHEVSYNGYIALVSQHASEVTRQIFIGRGKKKNISNGFEAIE